MKAWNGAIPTCIVCGRKNFKEGGFYVGRWEGYTHLIDKWNLSVCPEDKMKESWVNPGEMVDLMPSGIHYKRNKKDGMYYG